MSRPVLRARGLTVRDRRYDAPLVGPLDLEVGAGKRVALLGRSGCGKSLTLRAVLGALPAGLVAQGTVETAGRVAWVQQDTATALHPLVPLHRQLERPLRRRGLTRDEARTRRRGLLERVGLDDAHAAARPGELSGGERQRGCLALALLAAPDLLLADEPTTALDTVASRAVLDVLADLDAAVVLVTHDRAAADRLGARPVRLDAGLVVA